MKLAEQIMFEPEHYFFMSRKLRARLILLSQFLFAFISLQVVSISQVFGTQTTPVIQR